MNDKVAVVTGANAGLGYEVALDLARRGDRVVMACRSLERAVPARERLLAEVPDAGVEIIQLDVSEPESIRRFSQDFSERFDRLDLLVNNAGIVGDALARNSQGYEMQLATNYLGAFALTGRLLPCFSADGPGRIVNVGSLGHRLGKLDLDDINWHRRPYKEMAAYCQSKLAVITFTLELDRRLRATGSRVMVLGAHPGFAATEIARKSRISNPNNRLGQWFTRKMETRVPTPAAAARPILYAACHAGVQGGDYYGPGGWLEIAGEPAPARVRAAARDVDLGRRLWQLSESLTGVAYLSDKE